MKPEVRFVKNELGLLEEIEEDEDEEDEKSNGSYLSNLNSENEAQVEAEWERARLNLVDSATLQKLKAEKGDQEKEAAQVSSIAVLQQGFIHKRKTFDARFEETFKTFTENMQMLDTQRKKIEKTVNQIQEDNHDTSNSLEKLNTNLDLVMTDLTEMDTVIEAIKNK